MKISHPSTGLPLIARDGREAFITVLSLDSKVAKDFDREVLDRRVSRRIRPTASEIEQENLLKAAKLVASLPWFLVDPTTLEAIEEPCTEANARELFSECPWVLEQVLEYAAARANFMKN
jgi:hypothetical protein